MLFFLSFFPLWLPAVGLSSVQSKMVCFQSDRLPFVISSQFSTPAKLNISTDVQFFFVSFALSNISKTNKQLRSEKEYNAEEKKSPVSYTSSSHFSSPTPTHSLTSLQTLVALCWHLSINYLVGSTLTQLRLQSSSSSSSAPAPSVKVSLTL